MIKRRQLLPDIPPSGPDREEWLKDAARYGMSPVGGTLIAPLVAEIRRLDAQLTSQSEGLLVVLRAEVQRLAESYKENQDRLAKADGDSSVESNLTSNLTNLLKDEAEIQTYKRVIRHLEGDQERS